MKALVSLAGSGTTLARGQASGAKPTACARSVQAAEGSERVQSPLGPPRSSLASSRCHADAGGGGFGAAQTASEAGEPLGANGGVSLHFKRRLWISRQCFHVHGQSVEEGLQQASMPGAQLGKFVCGFQVFGGWGRNHLGSSWMLLGPDGLRTASVGAGRGRGRRRNSRCHALLQSRSRFIAGSSTHVGAA